MSDKQCSCQCQETKVEAEYLNPQQLAELVNVPLKWIRNNSCRIPGHTKIGNLARYKKTAIIRALETGKLLRD